MLPVKYPLSLFLLFFSIISSAQTAYDSQIIELSKDNPDENCIVLDEAITYSFVTETKNGVERLVIIENGTSNEFTPQDYFSRNQTVFYDSYSEVTSMTYKTRGRTPGLLSLVRGNYENSGIFHDDVKLCGYEVKMKKNDLYTFLYTKKYYNPRFISKLYFNNSFPTEEKKVSFEIPQSVNADILEINFDGFDIQKTEKNDAAKKVKIVTYTAKKLKAFPSERNMPGLAKAFPHVIVVVKSFKGKKTSEEYFSSKKDIYNWCKQLADSVDNKPEELKEQVNQIVGSESDPEKKMEKIFYWIQDHVRYIAFEDGIMGYKPQAAYKVYNLLYGDCKGVANLCKQMQKLAGLDARLTWIGTKDIPYSNDLPFLGVYNHMICTVFLNGKRYFLDCTETFISIDDYAERIQGRPVMIEDGKNFIDDKIPVANPDRNMVSVSTRMSIDGVKLKGNSKLMINGEEKTNVLRAANDMKTENQREAIKRYLESDNANVSVKKFNNTNLNERKGPLTINSEFEMNNSVFYNKASKEIILLPERDEEFKYLTMDTARKSDFEFDNKYYLNSVTEITVPEGYSTKHVPTEVKINTPAYDFELNYQMINGVLRLSKKLQIKQPLIKKKDFQLWNNNITKLNQFYSDAVILKS